MWYVIHTQKGRENKAAREIRDDVASGDENVFIFENEMEYKIKGEWIKDRKPFFPGYIFAEMEKEQAEDFNKRLLRKSYKLVDVDGVITPIREEEQTYLMKLGGEEHIVRHSEGFRVDDRVEITHGSFRGYKGEIKKLDRHNRRARVDVPLMGRNMEVEISLEIVRNLTFEELEANDKIDRLNMAKVLTGKNGGAV